MQPGYLVSELASKLGSTATAAEMSDGDRQEGDSELRDGTHE